MKLSKKALIQIAMIIMLIIVTIPLLFATDSTGDTDHKSTGDRIASWLKDDLGINPYLSVLIIATLPVVELRGAIPTGILLLKLDWIPVIILSIIGNMLPIFFILFFLKYFEKLFRKIPLFDRLFNWVFKRTMAKSAAVEKYEEAGLMLFVAIPLPITGAWTGSLVSYILKLNYWKSLLFIFLGVLIAGAIVTTLTFFVTIGFGLFIIIGVILLFIIIKTVIKIRKTSSIVE